MIPGEYFLLDGTIELNVGRPTVTLTVANSGDRPVQVGSHYHFAETNAALVFDRAVARGYRLNIAAGTAVRFEPGQTRTVELVAYAGDRIVYGFKGAVMGPLDAPRTAAPRGKADAAKKGAAKKPPAAKSATAKKPTAKKATAKKATAKKATAKKATAKKATAKRGKR